MTDNEIIKSLECCLTDSCRECPFEGFNTCMHGLPREALALIKMQQARIKRLEYVIATMREESEGE